MVGQGQGGGRDRETVIIHPQRLAWMREKRRKGTTAAKDSMTCVIERLLYSASGRPAQVPSRAQGHLVNCTTTDQQHHQEDLDAVCQHPPERVALFRAQRPEDGFAALEELARMLGRLD